MNFEKSMILVREVSERVPMGADLSPPGLRLHYEEWLAGRAIPMWSWTLPTSPRSPRYLSPEDNGILWDQYAILMYSL